MNEENVEERLCLWCWKDLEPKLFIDPNAKGKFIGPEHHDGAFHYVCREMARQVYEYNHGTGTRKDPTLATLAKTPREVILRIPMPEWIKILKPFPPDSRQYLNI